MTESTTQISAESAREKVSNGAVLIDVRTLQEFREGHIVGAIHIPHDQLAGRVEELGPDRSRAFVLYCKSGGRSGFATELLEKLGFSAVFNAGGLCDLAPLMPVQECK